VASGGAGIVILRLWEAVESDIEVGGEVLSSGDSLHVLAK
jgi:hypothetical protein